MTDTDHATTNHTNKIIAIICLIVIVVTGTILLVRGDSAAPGENTTEQPSLYISPDEQTLAKNDQVTVSVWADSLEQKTSTIEADLNYPADILELVKVDSDKSSFKVALPVQQKAGYVSIVRGSTTPLKGTLLVATLTFQTKDKAGKAQVSFTKDSKMFATGKTKNILAATRDGKYTIK